jgi:hypothetical protein
MVKYVSSHGEEEVDGYLRRWSSQTDGSTHVTLIDKATGKHVDISVRDSDYWSYLLHADEDRDDIAKLNANIFWSTAKRVLMDLISDDKRDGVKLLTWTHQTTSGKTFAISLIAEVGFWTRGSILHVHALRGGNRRLAVRFPREMPSELLNEALLSGTKYAQEVIDSGFFNEHAVQHPEYCPVFPWSDIAPEQKEEV